ncbi:alpha/beta fold hydrolase [candidate division WWE3 bacterium]|jgi:dipeptidyl aminopeptidase/acylaminoacyl peptidase|uniref:Alpha/beta fold hydrolase n=1 Tax=candidate division WWE3 bacterium TaxID=2053526 RepID=A0A3A4ZHE6_UNCKA|nr:MAG: alpha/beta fold hydrolase [candidate division WWE3 bacterium]
MKKPLIIAITLFVALFILVFYLLLNRQIQPITQNVNLIEPPENANKDSAVENTTSFIENLRARDYTESEIKIEETLAQNDLYTKYLISYISDNLKIYGVMNLPKGDGPFPVIILNHGYFNTSSFNSGDGTQTMADILARNSYLTLASDYRGHGKSENDSQDSRGHRPEYAIDVLNLIVSVKNLEKADSTRIGMWGHSMGGEIALRTAEVTNMLKVVVLWAPTSARTSDNSNFYGGTRNNQGSTSTDAEGSSPINYLKYISTPVSLHQGLSDIEVNPEWSKELKEALEIEGKQVEYFEYPGQDHNFRNLGWNIISERTVSFLDKYLKE